MNKLNSDTANKMIKNLKAQEAAIIAAEERDKTYSFAPDEKPRVPKYSFEETQAKLQELRGKISALRHAINRHNVETHLPDLGNITVDEALSRMHDLNEDKKRLFALLGVPEETRCRSYGSREPDIVCRNFNVDLVQKEYDRTCEELLMVQQAINMSNMTDTFEVDL